MVRLSFSKDTSRFLNASSLVGVIFSALCHAGALYIERTHLEALERRCSFTAGTFTDYHNNAVDILGRRKGESVLDAAIRESLRTHPLIESEIVETGYGHTLCYDVFTHGYFYSDIERIRQTVERLNGYGRRIILNEFLKALRLPYYGRAGEVLGWSKEVAIYYSSHETEDGRPVFALFYKPETLM